MTYGTHYRNIQDPETGQPIRQVHVAAFEQVLGTNSKREAFPGTEFRSQEPGVSPIQSSVFSLQSSVFSLQSSVFSLQSSVFISNQDFPA
ncbi:MAG: hypothetical protein ACFB8W_16685 [Elainellaceae cyanobacterium]